MTVSGLSNPGHLIPATRILPPTSLTHPASMPKKRHNPLFTKPVDTPHHTLLSSSSRNDRFQSSSSSAQPSVNDLIHHLRRTQVSSSDDRTSPSGFVAPRSVHPSLRNLLELPETPPPRPRPNARRVGVGRLRRTPGPPPPESWLLGNNQNTNNDFEQEDIDTAAESERVIYRPERLPGTTFPPKNGLLHMTLKAMAQHWAWHVAYDGQFLAMLPTHVKVLLLSYIAVYGRDQPLRGLVRGLKPLISVDENDEDYQGAELDGISRLDLGGALGRWMGFKELNNELFLSQKPGDVDLPRKSKEVVPASWEEEYEEEEASAIPRSLDHGCRFENLRFLSLAHPHPTAANWKSLLKLLSRLPILTHLSLAHWPVPTLTPNAINARVRHPAHRSLTFSYGGTDTYSAMENNWAEAAGILRKLSHATYCLKWLDLEGCGDWSPALTWTGHGPDGEVYRTGPEWNGAWRDIEWIRLGPGWLPHIDDAEILGLHTRDAGRPPVATTTRPQQQQQYQPPAFRSLASSIHAPPTPPPSLSRIRGIETDDDDDDSGSDTSWDVEVERVKYRRAKELERYREMMRTARTVQQQVQQLRREGKGKWVHFSLGIEELKEDVVRELLGEGYTGFLP